MISIVKTPGIMIRLFPSLLWKVPEQDNVIYITFDDGPTAKATPFVLSLLEKFKAKATFFCVGDNIRKSPDIFMKIISQGHCIGNHTFNHLNGWITDRSTYIGNVNLCDEIIKKNGYKNERILFRPPYGRITFSQLRSLKTNYKIVMWDILTMDFNPGKNPAFLLNKIINSTVKGSIVIFHDSEKSYAGLQILLESFLNHFSNAGYRFASLEKMA